MRQKKASLHVSVDEKLKHRLQLIAAHLSVPMSHLVSMSLGKFAMQYERKFIDIIDPCETDKDLASQLQSDQHSEASLDTG